MSMQLRAGYAGNSVPAPVDLTVLDGPVAIDGFAAQAVAGIIAAYAVDDVDQRELAAMVGVPVLPRPARRERPPARCRACGYLVTAPGHRASCGSAP